MKLTKGKKGKSALVLTLLATMIALPLTVSAAQTSEETVSVFGGALRVTQSKVALDPVRLSTKSAQKVKGSSELLTDDSRGSGAGWVASVGSTDFVMKKTVNGVEKTFVIPANTIKFSAKINSVISGEAIPFGQGRNYLAKDVTLGSTPSEIIRADSGFGMGAYRIGIDYDVQIPETIVTTDGDTYGVMEGVYRATFTFTAVSGI